VAATPAVTHHTGVTRVNNTLAHTHSAPPTRANAPVKAPKHPKGQKHAPTITDELAYTPNIDAAHLGVSVDNRIATLSGDVASLPERQAARRAALRVAGVKAVTDRMVVRDPGISGPKDADLARAANQLLDWAVEVPADAVKASVRDHVVTLSGNVTWKYQRVAASRAVSHLRGVTGVNNTIGLTQSGPASGAKAAVQAAILRNRQLNEQMITVELDDRALTLRGTVRSWAERQEAENAAWSAAGVTTVSNDLHVTS
jgi:osmotically-inducible protein OsmY